MSPHNLISGLAKTRAGLLDRLKAVFGAGRKLDPEALERLEETLLAADCGLAATGELLGAALCAYQGRDASPADLQAFLRAEIVARLGPAVAPACAASGPTVILVVGVNGSGKTTTVAKLAHQMTGAGKRVIVGAADTFRAAAVEQLATWCARVGVECIRHTGGGDPAAVAFDACQAAVARSLDAVLVDTAGRLHTYGNLMRELEKVARVSAKAVAGAPHEVLLVLDATAGQNALSQAREFGKAIGLTGVALAKMDGTAKGGIVLAIQRELAIPVKFVGTGETVEDLAPFDPAAYAEGILGGG